MSEKLTEEEWIEIHNHANQYYIRHGSLIHEMYEQLPVKLRDEWLDKISEMNTVYRI
jgi:hypothetical protein